MASVSELILQRQQQNQDVLIGYFPAGFPTIADSVEACVAMCKAGVDVLELGVPYSDPVMDGLIIQEATETALANGFKLRQLFDAVKQITSQVDTPVLIMSYWNPIIQFGVRKFAEEVKNSGAKGIITPDLIPDEATEWITISDELGLDRVFLATPSSSPERLAAAAKASRGFIYAVSTMGITGAREDLDAKARAVVSGVKATQSQTPVFVGIGISTAAQVREVNSYSHGAIVGSALIKAYNQGGVQELVSCVKELKAGAQ